MSYMMSPQYTLAVRLNVFVFPQLKIRIYPLSFLCICLVLIFVSISFVFAGALLTVSEVC